MDMQSSPPTNTPEKRWAWANRLTVMAALSLVMGPIGFYGGRHEVARWHAAAAQEQIWSSQPAAAIEHLDRALEWDPQNPAFWILRAKQWEALGDFSKALADIEQAVAVQPTSLAVNSAKAELLVKMGRAEEAAELWLAVASWGPRTDPGEELQVQNGAAYYCALANQHLEQAEQHIQEAFKILNELTGTESRDPSILDTRGYVYYRLGKLDKARRDLDQAVLEIELAERSYDARIVAGAIDPRQVAQQREAYRRTIAVLRYHRSLVLEAQGLEIEAALDRARVRELGFVPDEQLF
jgi:tetratricopeptide (TPR) repeat protein